MVSGSSDFTAGTLPATRGQRRAFGLLFGTSFEVAVSKPIARFCGVASSEARMRFGVSCDTFRNGEIPS